MSRTRGSWHLFGPKQPRHQALLAQLRIAAVTPVSVPLQTNETITAGGLLLSKPPGDFRIGDQYPVVVFLFPIGREALRRELWPRALFLCPFSSTRIFCCPFVDKWTQMSPEAQQVIVGTQATRLNWPRFHLMASRAVLEQRFSRYLDFLSLQHTGTAVPSITFQCETKSLPRHPALVDAYRALDVDFQGIISWLRECLHVVDPKGRWTLIGEGPDSSELKGCFPAWDQCPDSQTALFAERQPQSLKVPNRPLTILDVWGTFRWRLPHIRVLRLNQLPKPPATA